MAHATKEVNLEDIILSEISQLQKGQLLYDSTYVRNLYELEVGIQPRHGEAQARLLQKDRHVAGRPH